MRIRIGDGGRFATLSSSTRYVSLIKIGPLTPGSYTIEASSFPTASDDILNSRFASPIQGLPLRLNNVTFQGNLTVSTQTCATPDVAVTLGSYEIHDYLQRNSTTPWLCFITLLMPDILRFYIRATCEDVNFIQVNSCYINHNSIGRLTPPPKCWMRNGIMATTQRSLGSLRVGYIRLGESSQRQRCLTLRGAINDATKDGIRHSLPLLPVIFNDCDPRRAGKWQSVFRSNYY